MVLLCGFLFAGCDYKITNIRIEYVLTGPEGATIVYGSCSTKHNGKCNGDGNINVLKDGLEMGHVYGPKAYVLLSGKVKARFQLFRDGKMCADQSFDTSDGTSPEFILICDLK